MTKPTIAMRLCCPLWLPIQNLLMAWIEMSGSEPETASEVTVCLDGLVCLKWCRHAVNCIFFLLSFLRAKKKRQKWICAPSSSWQHAVCEPLRCWLMMCSLFHLSWDVVPRHPMKNCTLRRSCPDLFLASLHCSNVKGSLGDNQGQDNRSGSLPSGGKSQGDILHSASGRKGCGFFPSTSFPFCAPHGQHSLISSLRLWKNYCWGKPLNFLFPRPRKAAHPKVWAWWATWFLQVCQGWLRAPTACADTDLQIKQLFRYLWRVSGEKQPFTL